MGAPDLTITVRHSAGYEPSPRLAAAIEELRAALAEDHDADEVTGFDSGSGMATGRRVHRPVVWTPPTDSFVFHTITWTFTDGGITHEDSWED